MSDAARPFRYLADPVCLAAVALYVINRCVLKSHGWGGTITHGYVNDVLCLPLFLPGILYAQRLLRLRDHDCYPRAWEIVHHWAVFSLVFEVVTPRFPAVFRTTADVFDVAAYLVGGALAWCYWRVAAKRGAAMRSDGVLSAGCGRGEVDSVAMNLGGR